MNLKKVFLFLLAVLMQACVPDGDVKSNIDRVIAQKEISYIKFINKSGKFILKRSKKIKASEAFNFEDHPNWAVDKDRITNLLNSLELLSVKNSFTVKTEKLAEFGLADPQATIKLGLASGADLTILLGSYSEYARKYYAMLTSKEEIFLVPEEAYVSLTRPALYYRSKKLFPLAATTVCLVKVEGPDSSFSLEYGQKSKSWILKQGLAERPASSRAVAKLLEELKNIEFSGDQPNYSGQFLNTFTIEDCQGEKRSLRFSSLKNNVFDLEGSKIVALADNNWPVFINRPELPTIHHKVEDFLPQRLVEVNLDQVQKVTYTQHDPLDIRIIEFSTNGWLINGHKADRAFVDQSIQSLIDVKTEQIFSSDKDLANIIDKDPFLDIELKTASPAGRLIVSIWMRKDKEAYLIKTDRMAQFLKIDKADIKKIFPALEVLLPSENNFGAS